MLQYRRIKEFTPPGETELIKYDEPVLPLVEFKNLSDFIKNYESSLDAIPVSERVNVYCTVNHVIPNVDKRVDNWKSQDLMFFDVDDVNEQDKLRHNDYLEAIAPIIGTTASNIVLVTTGSGFHILVPLKRPITNKTYFQENKLYYQVLCSRINDKFRDIGLSGGMDTQVFAPNRMFRAPLSTWQKMGEQRPVMLTHAPDPEKIEPVDFDLKKLSGLPDIEDKDTMSERELTYIKVDNQTVETGCDFLKNCKSKPGDVSEPEWYAMMSIIGRLDKGEEKVHEYSKGHPDYNERTTQRKMDQAIKMSGPRTCDNINTLWKGCESCPNYKKVKSPIALKGKDFIATAHSGFHMLGGKGGAQLIPQYDDLRKFYEKQAPYLNAAKVHYRFEESHWVEYDEIYIDNFAEGHFVPAPKNTMASEFRGKVKRTNLEKPEWFSESTDRRINLRNGVLNIDTGELESHSTRYGFKFCLPYDYEPEAQCPKFRQLLKNVTKNDVKLQMVLMEFMGYALSGDVPYAHKGLVLTGGGANGKSTFLKIFSALMGDFVEYLGVGDITNHFHLQMLDGCLLNIMEEVPKYTGSSKNVDFWELWKNIVQGGTVTVAKKQGQPYKITPRAKFVMTCNELPKGANQNEGYWRRMLIAPFNAEFKEGMEGFNRHLDREIIKEELPGVLNLCLAAYKNFKKNGYNFTKSSAVKGALDDYKTEVDSVRRWVLENVELGQVDSLTELNCGGEWMKNDSKSVPVASVKDMYAAYRQDTLEAGEKPVSDRMFSKRLIGALEHLGWDSKKLLGERNKFPRLRLDGKLKPVVHGIRYAGSGI